MRYGYGYNSAVSLSRRGVANSMNTELVVAVVIIIIYNVIFNRKVLRFEMTYFGEYAEHLKTDESKSDAPYIEIGTCTPIS